jgi:hypothetical protein
MERMARLGWKSWIACMTLTMSLSSPALAADIEFERKMLVGLPGVGVIVEQIDSDMEQAGLERFILQTDVELRLRQAGVKVLTKSELAAPGSDFLLLSIHGAASRQLRNVFALCVRLELAQGVMLIRRPSVTSVGSTWFMTTQVVSVGTDYAPAVREAIRDMVDQFINAYLAANPKR